jgi:hypothetical protein
LIGLDIYASCENRIDKVDFDYLVRYLFEVRLKLSSLEERTGVEKVGVRGTLIEGNAP